MPGDNPRTPAEWEAYEAKVAQESANEKAERHAADTVCAWP